MVPAHAFEGGLNGRVAQGLELGGLVLGPSVLRRVKWSGLCAASGRQHSEVAVASSGSCAFQSVMAVTQRRTILRCDDHISEVGKKITVVREPVFQR